MNLTTIYSVILIFFVILLVIEIWYFFVKKEPFINRVSADNYMIPAQYENNTYFKPLENSPNLSNSYTTNLYTSLY